MESGIGRLAAVFWALFCPLTAMAQIVPPSEQLGRERERFVEPRVPQAQPGGVAITLPSTTAPSGAGRIQVHIRDICIQGGSVFSKDDLAPLFAEIVGKRVALQAVYDLAKAITAKYGAEGYALSRAVVPPQRFSPDGAVPCIQIVEGFIERVEWPANLGRYRNFFDDYAAAITAQRPVNVRTIERYMLLAGDLPGLKFSASLKASKTELGASILVVEVKQKPVDLLGRFDNRGTEARGPMQFLASATANNWLGRHEAFSLAWAATTQLKELEYFSGSYRQVLTSEGLFAFVNASHGFGKPGTSALEAINFKTRSTIVEAGVASPMIRTREANLLLTALGFMSDNDSEAQSAPFNIDRLRGVRAKADADFADRFLGINQINLTASQGIDGLGSTANGSALASRAAGRVDFTKIEATLSRIQPLVGGFSAFGSLYGQYSGTSLLAPEQCSFGGRYFGRAFDPSQLLGDHCLEAIGELRFDLPKFNEKVSQIQFYGYGDRGTVWTKAPAAGTAAQIDAASIGGGIRIGWLDHLTADLSVAKAVAGPRDDTRYFFILTGRH